MQRFSQELEKRNKKKRIIKTAPLQSISETTNIETDVLETFPIENASEIEAKDSKRSTPKREATRPPVRQRRKRVPLLLDHRRLETLRNKVHKAHTSKRFACFRSLFRTKAFQPYAHAIMTFRFWMWNTQINAVGTVNYSKIQSCTNSSSKRYYNPYSSFKIFKNLHWPIQTFPILYEWNECVFD